MLGSLLSRFRVVMLLLGFGLGLAGGVVSDAAMASQMQGPMQSGLSTGHPCPACPDGQRSAMMPGCTAMAACWTTPALPAQGAALQRRPAAGFPDPADASIAGIASSPDPHPPRSSLPS